MKTNARSLTTTSKSATQTSIAFAVLVSIGTLYAATAAHAQQALEWMNAQIHVDPNEPVAARTVLPPAGAAGALDEKQAGISINSNPDDPHFPWFEHQVLTAVGAHR